MSGTPVVNPADSDADAAWDIANVGPQDMSRLVRILAGRLLAGLPRSSGVEMADLIQAGDLGLMQAVRTFGPKCGASLAGYAKFRIRGEMLDAVRRNASPGRRFSTFSFSILGECAGGEREH